MMSFRPALHKAGHEGKQGCAFYLADLHFSSRC
jgi:hypothetical protein